jgi:co-chaperonin GroES (HSP10)
MSDRMVVELDPRQVLAGNLIIPDKHQKVATWGTVRATGPEVKELGDGDRVYITRAVGTRLVTKVGEFVVVREGQILARES